MSIDPTLEAAMEDAELKLIESAADIAESGIESLTEGDDRVQYIDPYRQIRALRELLQYRIDSTAVKGRIYFDSFGC